MGIRRQDPVRNTNRSQPHPGVVTCDTRNSTPTDLRVRGTARSGRQRYSGGPLASRWPRPPYPGAPAAPGQLPAMQPEESHVHDSRFTPPRPSLGSPGRSPTPGPFAETSRLRRNRSSETNTPTSPGDSRFAPPSGTRIAYGRIKVERGARLIEGAEGQLSHRRLPRCGRQTPLRGDPLFGECGQRRNRGRRRGRSSQADVRTATPTCERAGPRPGMSRFAPLASGDQDRVTAGQSRAWRPTQRLCFRGPDQPGTVGVPARSMGWTHSIQCPGVSPSTMNSPCALAKTPGPGRPPVSPPPVVPTARRRTEPG